MTTNYIVKSEISISGNSHMEKKWGSNDKSARTENQHKKRKKWYTTTAPIRNKKRWNKKRGILEYSKKGCRSMLSWSD